MKTIIAGSRRVFQDHPEIYYVADAMIEAFRERGISPTEIVSGGARGIDKAGEMWAGEHGIPVVRFIPDWNGPLGKAAGFKRNQEMVDYADAAVYIWDGQSRGTMDCIKRAKEKGIPHHVYMVKKHDYKHHIYGAR